MISKNYDLVKELVGLTLGLFSAAKQAPHPGSPFSLTSHVFVFYLKANSLH